MPDRNELLDWNERIFEVTDDLVVGGVHHLSLKGRFDISVSVGGTTAVFRTLSAHWHDGWRNVPLRVEWNAPLASSTDLSSNTRPDKFKHFMSPVAVSIHGSKDGARPASHAVYIVPLSGAPGAKWSVAIQVFAEANHDDHGPGGIGKLHAGIVHGDEP